MTNPCVICPRRCRVDRQTETGACGVGYLPVVASFGPHFGEERPLVGAGGSGTIFLAGCNLLCRFCQNYDISHGSRGVETPPARLAEIMIGLDRAGCENINFVTPTHFAAPIAEAICLARDQGLAVPVVYNSSGYDSVKTLKCIEGLIDIYMPDAKFASPDVAELLTGRRDYPEAMFAAVREMHRQVGDLVIEGGVARRGLLVRHLVMPEGLAGTREIVDYLVREISPETYINVMGQYRPCGTAGEIPEIARRARPDEIGKAVAVAREAGLRLAGGE